MFPADEGRPNQTRAPAATDRGKSLRSGQKPKIKMRTLRVASLVTVLGGVVGLVRFAQALAAEMAFSGPTKPMQTVPIFLILGLVPLVLFWCSAAFWMTPNRRIALWVSRGCAFSLSILLPNLSVGAGLSVPVICLIYFFVLKPAVIAAYGAANEPNPEPASRIAPCSS